MLTFAEDKMDGFTQEYADQLKHRCGTCFSSGLVDVGITSTHNGRMAYTCEKCVAEKAAKKAQEAADSQTEFAKRWVGHD